MAYKYADEIRRIANRVAARGYKVVFVDGWESRGRGEMKDVKTFIVHHTGGATAAKSNTDMASLSVLVNGRAGLSGPLCQFGGGRTGTLYVIAAGIGNHAGRSHETNMGNSYAFGLELENAGTSADPWPKVQKDMASVLAEEVMREFSIPKSRVLGHKETCTPKGRKVDPSFDMGDFRGTIGAVAAPERPKSPTTPQEPKKAPTTPQEPKKAQRDVEQSKAVQRAVGASPDGFWGDDTDSAIATVLAARKGSFPKGIKAAQKAVGVMRDGSWGPKSRSASVRCIMDLQRAVGTRPDSVWGPKSAAALKTARAKNYKVW